MTQYKENLNKCKTLIWYFIDLLQIELQNYANQTYQNSNQFKVTEEQTTIKRLRREIDEARLTLDQIRH